MFLRPLYDDAFFLAFILAYRIHANDGEGIVAFPLSGCCEAAGSVMAIALFGAMGEIISYTGYCKGFSHLVPGSNVAIACPTA